MLRILLCLLLSFTLTVVPAASASARVDPSDPVADSLELGAELEGMMEGVAGGWERLLKAYESWGDHGSNLDAIKTAVKDAGEAKALADGLGKTLSGGKIAWHIANGEWKEAAKTALAEVIDMAGTGVVYAAAVWVGGLCSGVLLTAVCFTAVLAAGTHLKSKAAEMLAGGIVDGSVALYCRFRPSTNSCDMVPAMGPVFAQGPPLRPIPPDISPPDKPDVSPALALAGGGGVKPERPDLDGRAGGGGGRTQIDVSTGDIRTSAVGGGSAITDIATLEKGGKAVVRTGDVRTTSTGTDASTTIGGGSGTVVTGDIINRGGDLEIGAGGTTRDGKKCVEIYRQTCIIHYYFRRKNDPCLPGYWIDGRKCRLPADTRHKID